MAGGKSGRYGLPGGLFPVPGKKFVETRGRLIGDAGQHVGEPCLWISVIELGRADQDVDRGRPFSAAIERIKAYWLAKGHEIEVRVELIDGTKATYAIRSNLGPDGLP